MNLICNVGHGKPIDLFYVRKDGDMIIAKCLNCGAEWRIGDSIEDKGVPEKK